MFCYFTPTDNIEDRHSFMEFTGQIRKNRGFMGTLMILENFLKILVLASIYKMISFFQIKLKQQHILF